MPLCARLSVPPNNSVSPGDEAPATRAVEHLYSSFQVPRCEDGGEDVGSMRSAGRDVKTWETPTGTEMTIKIKQ